MKNLYFAYRSFWPELETMKKFREAGINTICFFPSNTSNSFGEPYSLYPPIWNYYDLYDFDSLDRQINDIISANPDAELLCMIDLNTPAWLTRALAVDSMVSLGFTVNNPAWIEHTTKYLSAFLKYCEHNHSSCIKAYILSAGLTSEWQDSTHGDMSDLREAGFKNWLVSKGKKPQRIPEKAARDAATHDMLRDPEQDAHSLDYWRFCNEKIIDTIQYFVAQTRQSIPTETEVGVFFGYILEHAYDRHISLGHLDYERLASTPGIDFFIAPATYEDRMIGGGSGFMTPRESLRLKGLQYMHECDQRTHTMNMKIGNRIQLNDSSINWQRTWNNEAETIAGIKREVALCLTSRSSLWWFDMWGGFYEGENVMATFKKMKEIWDEHSHLETENNAEVLFVLDPEGSYYLNEKDVRIIDFIVGTRCKLNRIGSPYSICSLNDLAELPLDNYKLIVMPNAFVIDDDKHKFLQEKILNSNRTVLWFLAPGISDKQKYRPERVKQICGVAFGTEGLQTVDMKTWKSAYISAPANLTVEMLSTLAREAGVHRYCEPGEPVFANDKFLAIHTPSGGTQKILLPKTYQRVVELFSGKVVAENTAQFNYNFEIPDTALFKLC